MPLGARSRGGASTKGDHHVATACTDDRGHDLGWVGCWNAEELHSSGLPIGGALPALARATQRRRGTGLPAWLAPERRGPRHVQNQPVRAAVPLLPYAEPRVGVIRGKKG